MMAMVSKWKQSARFAFIVALLCSLVFPNAIFAAYTHQPVAIPNTPVSPINITVNGKNVISDLPPKFIDSKIWVSAEAMAHYFYAVYYESIDGKKFVLKNDYYEMTAEYGKGYVVLGDGSTIATDLPFKDDVRSFIPLDTLMYAFQATYSWNAATNTAEVLYDENRHLADEAAIPLATPADITITGKSRDAFYSIPVSDPNAKVTVWRKSGNPQNYVTREEPQNTGYAWVIQPAPAYTPATGAFEGGVTNTNATVSPEFIRVKIEYSDGITPDKVFKTTYTTHSQGDNEVPDEPFLLKSTFNNISVYLYYSGYTAEDMFTYTLPIKAPNTTQLVRDPATEVRYRQVGSMTWNEALPLAFDHDRKQFRGSIVGLEQDTEYEVEVKVLDDNSTHTGTIRTWKEEVPIAKDIPIASIYEPGKPLSIAGLHGSEDGYIRIIGDGSTVIDVTNEFWEAVAVAQSEYVILENLIIRGGQRGGISVLSSSHHIRIVNCDISNFGRASTQYLGPATIIPNPDPNLYVDLRTGWPYAANAIPIPSDAGIYITDANYIDVERNYIHDPVTKGTAWSGGGARNYWPGWDERHPLGADGMYLRGGEGIVIRYNDIIGSDDHRFNDPISGIGNHDLDGGLGVDSDVYGNYLAFAQADGIELEGSVMNVRVYDNKIEGVAGGWGMDSVYVGPLYVYRNLLLNLGDEFNFVPSVTKHGTDPLTWQKGLGVNYLFNNTILSHMSHITVKENQLYRAVYRNNIIESIDSPLLSGQYAFTIRQLYNYPGNSFDYDLFNGASESIDAVSTGGPTPIMEPHGVTGPKNGVKIQYDNSKKATFVNRADGDLSQTSTSLGYDAGTTIPNFVTDYEGAAPDIGAIESGTDVIIPTRPTPLRSEGSQYQVNITGNGSAQVTIKTDGIPTGTTYDLRKSADNDWFTVTNAAGETQGVITEGVDLVLTLTGDPKKIGKNYLDQPFGTTVTDGHADMARTVKNVVTGLPGVGKGAFLVKLNDGFALPVSVFVTAADYDATYTVTYKDGDEIVQEQSVTAGGSSLGHTVIPLTLSKEGYTFLGWYDETYAHKYDFSKPIEDNTVLYAKWQDHTPPTIVTPERLSFQHSEPVLVQLTAFDALSGISSLDVTFNGEAAGATIALDPLTLRVGTYPIVVRAADRAGNVSTAQFELEITIDADHLDDVVQYGASQGWIDDSGIVNSLLTHADNIQRDQNNAMKLETASTRWNMQ